MRCGCDLGELVDVARFCPVCGLELSESRGHDGQESFSTTIVRGYAHAMFRLGVRYEVRHNDDEAVRCYDKSSRLGDERATGKILEIPVASIADGDEPAQNYTPQAD